jgi:hypothetical protein
VHTGANVWPWLVLTSDMVGCRCAGQAFRATHSQSPCTQATCSRRGSGAWAGTLILQQWAGADEVVECVCMQGI